MEKLNILVCAHKQDPNTRNDQVFKAVQGGRALHPDLDLGFLNDNTGDNISARNPFWSELTVLYWGWKNISDVEYMGLNHYRRYFDIDVNDIDALMDGYDMIVGKSNTMMSNHERARNLMHMTSIEDYYVFADTFLSMHPECEQAFMEYFYHSRKSYPFQMFIASKKLYDEYCQFMFPVLFETEKRVKPHGYTRQKRTVGYFGEWFLGLYIYCRNLRVKTVPIVDLSCAPCPMPPLKSRIVMSAKRLFNIVNDKIYKMPSHLTIPDGIKSGLRADNIELKFLR